MRLSKFLVVVLLFFLTVTMVCEAAPSDLIYEIDVEGEINPGLTRLIQKSVEQARNNGAEALILKINTFGGYVDSAVMIRDILIDAPVTTVAYIKDRAWSAGALITLSCDKIFMAPGSSFGAAETRPKEEKYISAFRKEFKATAEKMGRNPDVAAAMVDSDIEIEGVIEKGKLLTLTATEAVKLKMADEIVHSNEEILKILGFENGIIQTIKATMLDNFIRIITNPYISSLLVIIGFIGLVVEATTLGWGVGGTIGVISLALFFSGNMLVGNTNWGLIILFIAGVILLALEVFVIPGFGITGVSGIILMMVSIFLTINNPALAIYTIALALIFSIITFVILLKYFGKSKLWNKIALNSTQTKENGYIAPKIRADLMDKDGIALTILRPAGTALIDGERVDVISEGGYITKGSKIKVVKVEGTRVIVREV